MSIRQFKIKCDIPSLKKEIKTLYSAKSGKGELDVNSSSQCDVIKQKIIKSGNNCLTEIDKSVKNGVINQEKINKCINSSEFEKLYSMNNKYNLSISQYCGDFYRNKMPNMIRNNKHKIITGLNNMDKSCVKQIDKFTKTEEGGEYQKCLSDTNNNKNKLLKCNNILLNSLYSNFKSIKGVPIKGVPIKDASVRHKSVRDNKKKHYGNLIILIFILICVIVIISILCKKDKKFPIV